MCRQMRNVQSSLNLLAASVVVLVLASSGCNRVIPRETIAGTYQLQHKAGTIELILLLDGSFSETIRPIRGHPSTRRGRWAPPSADSPQIGLYGLWIPREFAPDYIQEADRANGDSVKYTDPGYWITTPSYGFGKIVIPIFADADVKFERTSPQRPNS